MRILIVLLCDFLIVLTCDLLIFNLFLYHIKKIDYKLPWVCTEIRHDDVNVGGTSETLSAAPRVLTTF